MPNGVQTRDGKRRSEEAKREDEKCRAHTVALHDLQELDNDLGAGSDHNLTLAGLLGVVDGVERIVENGSADHFGGLLEILKSRREMRYLP